jgi:hypothetical protein
MGGNIKVESIKDHGSKFIVTIPFIDLKSYAANVKASDKLQ